MNISLEYFMKEVLGRVKNPNGINRFNAYKIVKDSYCTYASEMGYCPGDCFECVEFLRKQLELGDTNSPGGAFVYRMRNGIAALQETISEKEKGTQSPCETGDHSLADLMNIFIGQLPE